MLTNKSRYPLSFEWDLAALAPPPGAGPPLPSADLLAGSPLQASLAITPPCGSLEPGERLVCRVALHAGVTPQVFTGEVRCHVRVDDAALEEAEAAAAAAGAAAAADAPFVEAVEEVIAEDPARGPPPPKPTIAARQRASKLRSRLPIHMYMTTAVRTRIEPLAQQFTATLEARTRRAAEASRGPSVPDPQVICVTLSGRILDPEHMAALRYVAPHERQAVVEAVECGACWVPPTLQPFWEGPPPPPAVVAAAAAAEPPRPGTFGGGGSEAGGQLPWEPTTVSFAGGVAAGGGGGARMHGSGSQSVGAGSSVSGARASSPLGAENTEGGGLVDSWPGLDPSGRGGREGGGGGSVASVPGPEGEGGAGEDSVGPLDFGMGLQHHQQQQQQQEQQASVRGATPQLQQGSSLAEGVAEEMLDVTFGETTAAGAAAQRPASVSASHLPSADAPQAAPLAELAPPPLLPPPAADVSGDQAAAASAREVLAGLFAELLDDPDVRRAFEFLPPPETPSFAEVRSAPPPCYDPRVRGQLLSPQKLQEAAVAAAATTTAAAAAPPSASASVVDLQPPASHTGHQHQAGGSAAASRAGTPLQGPGSGAGTPRLNGGGSKTVTPTMPLSRAATPPPSIPSQPQQGGGELALQGEDRPVGQHSSLEEELEADPELRRVVVSPEWRLFADFVLESALLGLMQESAAGDWEMPEGGGDG